MKECEKAFDEERDRFIKESEEKLDKLRQEIADVETKAIETRQNIAAEHADNLQNQILEDYNTYTALKRQLEAEGVALYNQQEEMRAVYVLNQEKLDYNYKLLASRDIECQNLIVNQKKKIGKL